MTTIVDSVQRARQLSQIMKTRIVSFTHKARDDGVCRMSVGLVVWWSGGLVDAGELVRQAESPSPFSQEHLCRNATCFWGALEQWESVVLWIFYIGSRPSKWDLEGPRILQDLTAWPA